MEFIVSEKNSSGRLLLVISDKEVIGKIFTEGRKQLDLTKEFYQGDKREVEYVLQKLEEVYIAHFTGKNAVALGIKLGLVDKDKILVVDNIPHAEVVVEG